MTAPRCDRAPRRLLDYQLLIPDAGRSAIQVPAIAVAGQYIYAALGWQVPLEAPEPPGGRLVRVPVTGGDVHDIGAAIGGTTGSTQALAVTSGRVVWFEAGPRDGSGGAIVSAPAEGGARTVLTTTVGSVSAVVADGERVYFSDGEGTKSVPFHGGAVRLLAPVVPYSLALWDGRLVLGTFGANSGVTAVPVEGGPSDRLFAEAGVIRVFPCAETVCWVAGAALAASLFELSESVTPRKVAADLVRPQDVVRVGDFFYAAASMGSLARIPAAGGAQDPIHDDALMAGLVADDECLYWSSATGIYSWSIASAEVAAPL